MEVCCTLPMIHHRKNRNDGQFGASLTNRVMKAGDEFSEGSPAGGWGVEEGDISVQYGQTRLAASLTPHFSSPFFFFFSSFLLFPSFFILLGSFRDRVRWDGMIGKEARLVG